MATSQGYAQPKAETSRLERLESKVRQLQAALAERPKDISEYNLPRELRFCGQKVDLDNPYIRDRLEKEFYLILGDRAQVVLWEKRARRAFPLIERYHQAS